MRFFTRVILPLFLFYVMMAFIQLDFNPMNWEEICRILVVAGYCGYLTACSCFSYLDRDTFSFWTKVDETKN